MGVSTEAGMNQAFITFDGNGKFNGNTSVNIFNGDYSIKGNELRLSNIAMTKMMGENMEIEDAVTEALNTVSAIAVEDTYGDVRLRIDKADIYRPIILDSSDYRRVVTGIAVVKMAG